MSGEYHIKKPENSTDFEAWMCRLENDLNPSQFRFATENARAILGLAGPGSGKTRALIYRCAHLIKSDIPPWQILLVTFTNKAAEVMKNRLFRLLEYYPEDIWAGTFHSIGARILRSNADLVGRTANFTILDEDDRAVILKGLLSRIKGKLRPEEQKLFGKRGFLGKVISQARNSGMTIEAVMDEYYQQLAEYTELVRIVAREYEERKIETNSFDFDDLLVKWLELFYDNPMVAKKYCKQFQHFLVDEFQDTNVIQGRIIDEFIGKSSVCVVGDDAQSIYAFRFAEVSNILDFSRRYPECVVVKMEQNYRSTPEIVSMVNHIIRNNPHQLPKHLVSMCSAGEKPWLVQVRDVYEEAAFVMQRIEELIDAGIKLRDMAVLYRSSYLTQDLEMEMLKRRVPYRTFGGLKFVQKAHIKDMVAWVKIMSNPRDEASWRRIIIMQPGLGPAAAEQLLKRIRESAMPLQDIAGGGNCTTAGQGRMGRGAENCAGDNR